MTFKDKFAIFVMAISICLGYAMGPARADTGNEGATRIERGSYLGVRTVSISTYTGAALFPASTKRPDSICRNNSASTIWIGTASVTALNDVAHPNVLNGFPVLSSETFKLDGSMTGVGYATAGPASTSGMEFRCIDGLVR